MIDSAEFPSFLKLLFKARLSTKPLIRKRFFYSHANKPHFHNNRFALSLVLECNRASLSLAFKKAERLPKRF